MTKAQTDERFTLDASDWPLIINDGDHVLATFPECEARECARTERIAKLVVRLLNVEARKGGAK